MFIEHTTPKKRGFRKIWQVMIMPQRKVVISFRNYQGADKFMNQMIAEMCANDLVVKTTLIPIEEYLAWPKSAKGTL